MAKKKAAGRAWRLLKLALVWARKGGVFRRGLAPGLRLVPSYLGSLRAAAAVRSDAISYGEREFSFDETPIFHFKLHRPSRSTRLLHIPCINNPPAVADDDVDGVFFGRVDDERERGWLRYWDGGDANSSTTEQGGGGGGGGERDTVVGAGGAARSSGSAEISGEARATTSVVVVEEGEAEEERCIDTEAEEFIAKFYEQMRLQRQISLLQYNEMLARSTG